MFKESFTALETVVEAAVNILGLETIAILTGVCGVIGVVLGITAIRKARQLGN